MNYRIGVDVGGTFTDFVLPDPDEGVDSYKEPSTPDDPSLAARLPEMHFTPSTQVWPEIRAYERSMLAVMNAYVHPMLNGYFQRLDQRLRAIGVDADLYITASNGNTLSVASARARVWASTAKGLPCAPRMQQFASPLQ